MVRVFILLELANIRYQGFFPLRKPFYQSMIAFTSFEKSFYLKSLTLLPGLEKVNLLCAVITSYSIAIIILNTLDFNNLFTCLDIMLVVSSMMASMSAVFTTVPHAYHINKCSKIFDDCLNE